MSGSLEQVDIVSMSDNSIQRAAAPSSVASPRSRLPVKMHLRERVARYSPRSPLPEDNLALQDDHKGQQDPTESNLSALLGATPHPDLGKDEQSPGNTRLQIPAVSLAQDLVEDSTKQAESKQVRFLSEAHQHMDDDTQFWTTYVKEAEEFDKELIDKWHKSLDVLLIFAALFSAINTAFIIESYKGLQPDSSEITNALLRLLLLHRNDDVAFSEADLGSLSSPAPVVPVNVLFFSSLTSSLIAAFGAVTAKQWLNEYANAGHMLPRHKQGQRRQAKYDGLTSWHFWFVMELLPILLQLSLLLFFAGTIVFLWPMNIKIATMLLGLVVASLAAYVATVLTSIIWPNSPFQTPVSSYLRSLVFLLGRRIREGSMPWYKSILEGLGYIGDIIQVHVTTGRFHSTAQSLHNPDPRGSILISNLTQFRLKLFGPVAKLLTKDSDHSERITTRNQNRAWDPMDVLNANSVMWLLEQAEHPDVTLGALAAIPRLPADLVLDQFKERETLFDRVLKFHRSLVPIARGSEPLNDVKNWVDSSIISSSVIHHVLKARKRGDETFQEEVRHFPYPTIPDLLPPNLDDVGKLVVHFCTNVQSGAAHTDILLLQRLLAQYPSSLSMQVEIPISDRYRTSVTESIVTTISPLSLLLDGVIACSAGRMWSGAGTVSYLHHPKCEPAFAEIFDQLGCMMDESEVSLDIVSHIAIAVATVQWYGRDMGLDLWSYPTEGDQENLKELLYIRYVDVDKGKDTLPNIALAISVAEFSTFDCIVPIYPRLVTFAESLLAERMDKDVLSYARHTVTVSFPNFAEGLLRLSRIHIGDIEVQHGILRILQCCPDGEWLSPLNELYGSDIINLLQSVLSMQPLTDNQGTIQATVDILNRISAILNDGAFEHLIVSPSSDLYQYRDYLYTIGFGSISGAEPFERKLLMLPLPSNEHAPKLLDLQTGLIRSILLRVIDYSRYCEVALKYIHGLMKEDGSLQWPGYFVAADIISLEDGAVAGSGISVKQGVEMLTKLLRDRNKRIIWAGEALLLLWNKTLGDMQRVNYLQKLMT
ncbi:hypothetical protein FRC03_010526 [Tulasnella sp. 419]|nr:hypothetical protein FRC03_010526 [Tulasnella sp. 419]